MRRRAVAVLGVVLAGLVPFEARAVLPGQLPNAPPATPLCGTVAGQEPRDDGRLRIATYNILHTQDSEGLKTIEVRVPLLVEAIAGSGADVVGLQEVAKSGNHGLIVQRLAKGLAARRRGGTWHWCWFASNPHVPYEPEPQPGGGGGPLTELAAESAGGQTDNGSEFREGVAVLSRFPITEAAVTRLPLRVHEAALCVPPDPINCNLAALFDSRVLMRARIEVQRHAALDLYVTHIAHGLTAASDDTKLRQVQAALEEIDATAETDTLPDVFVGDFNSVEDDDRYRAVVDHEFIDTYRAANPHNAGYTSSQEVRSPDATVDERIDFVFARPGSRAFVITESTVFGDQPAPWERSPDEWVWPSDHYAVVSEFTIGPRRR